MGLVLFALSAALLTTAGWYVLAYFTSPLRKYPGPLVAGWTNLYRFELARSGSYHHKVKALHEQYGPVVRLGPDLLDLDYPGLIKTIYGTDNKYVKTDFYHNNSTVIQGQIIYNLFSQTDVSEHYKWKRPVAKYYSPGAVLTVEPLADKVVDTLLTHLDERFAQAGKPCDLGEWVAFCTWDMVGAESFSEDLNYLATGRDHDGTIAAADAALDYFCVVGQMPFLDFWLDKNPVKRIGPPNLGNITRVAIEHIASRAQGKDPNFDPETPDYLQRFMEAKEQHPEVVHDGMIMNYLFINLIAGSDTTALTIRAVLYFALQHPEVHAKLKDEIRGAGIEGVAQYKETKTLSYLEAVIRESLRMHPGVAMILERHAPAEGLSLPGGQHVPGGTRVGINPYVVNRNAGIFDPDPDSFRPERWLQAKDETAEAYQERLQLYISTDLSFGAGSRICLGRHLALLKVYKIVATLINRYDIELVDPNKEWEVTCSWFPRQKGLDCYLKIRE